MRAATQCLRRAPSAGFSLIEVLVALIVLAVGLLGIAKMEALALSTTSVASQRSLAAIEAASLADAMHVNRGYWTTASNVTVNVTGTQITGAPGNTNADCAFGGADAPCTPANMAAYDLSAWATALNTLLPNDAAVVQCNSDTPIECSIQIQWSEQSVAMSSAQAAAASTPTSEANGTSAAIQNPTYTLYVEP